MSTGFYVHKTNAQQYPKLHLRTVKELMEGKGSIVSEHIKPSTEFYTAQFFCHNPLCRAGGGLPMPTAVARRYGPVALNLCHDTC